jgi:hypothetical protein
MIETISIKIMWVVFLDTFDYLVSCERTLREEILLAQETLFLDLVVYDCNPSYSMVCQG